MRCSCPLFVGRRGAAYVLALLPMRARLRGGATWLAGAFMFLLPMYFVIGQVTAGWITTSPSSRSITRCRCRRHGSLVYGSLYMCGFMLPLVVVRGHELFRPIAEGVPFVMVVSYAGFLLYPTIAPHGENAVVDGFASWSLQLFYDLDQPYGCFPSLHVAYSFVAALACYRMHRRVGRRRGAWAAIIGVSTVYTKQHFVVDAIAGAILGIGLRDLPARTPARSRA